MQDLGIRVPDKELTFVTPPNLDYCCWGVFFFLGDTIFASPICLDLCCGGSLHPVFQSFLEGTILYVAVDLLCLKEEVSSVSSYATILNLLLMSL